MATVFPLIVGMAHILLYAAAFAIALAAALLWSLHRSASQAERIRSRSVPPPPARPQAVRPVMFRMWSGHGPG